MRIRRLSGVALIAVLLSGCTTTGGSSTSIQCSLARILGQQTQGCSPGGSVSSPTAERWAHVQKVFDDEISTARAAQAQAVAQSAKLPAPHRATAGELTLLNVAIRDSKTKEARTIRTLDTVELRIPLAAKGKAEHLAAFNTFMDLANTLADNRGTASVTVYQNPSDVQAGRANPAGAVLKTKDGNPVHVRKVAQTSTPRGLERYVIQAGEVRGEL